MDEFFKFVVHVFDRDNREIMFTEEDVELFDAAGATVEVVSFTIAVVAVDEVDCVLFPTGKIVFT